MALELDFECEPAPGRPLGCVELWAGNERAHRHQEMAGLEADAIALPSGSRRGGDLCALFSCDREAVARVVLADVVGHGYSASLVAAHIHRLLHKYRDVPATGALLEALNDAFTLEQAPDQPLKLTTVVSARFERATGEFQYTYAAHPRMLLWRARQARLRELGRDLEGFPLGFIAGERYQERSERLEAGDMILAFSDGITEVKSPSGERMNPGKLVELADGIIRTLPQPARVHDLAEHLFAAVQRYHGSEEFDDDVTLLTLRRMGAE
ncbi:MAG TPA: PP2C family protein-serine/threonine phosphatase [Candidatus Acidoferrales bacterium]|nr:PP2C family protein-serine/threonine phosphatase [Candidatus Acidoferrales bacterium]